MTDNKSYGFIGLGHLGGYLATNLVRKGFAVTVFDLDMTARDKLAAAGARATDSVAEAAKGKDGLITCLPSPKATRQVLEGAEGALANMDAGACWIEMSTNHPKEIIELGALAAKDGVHTLEAPVTGGVHRAATGDITVLAGGPEDLFKSHFAALSAMGDPVLHIGELGKASSMKVVTNMLAFLHLLGASEALVYSMQAGIDLRVAFEAIKESSGTSFVHETESQIILNGSYDIGFTMELVLKDISIAMDVAKTNNAPMPTLNAMKAIFEEASKRYGADAWSPMVARLLEDAVGKKLRAPGFPASLEPS